MTERVALQARPFALTRILPEKHPVQWDMLKKVFLVAILFKAALKMAFHCIPCSILAMSSSVLS